MSSSAKHLHSIDAGHYKNTAGCETEVMPIPDIVKISMSQHIGAPCKPLVAKGDTVKVGQLIGDTDAFVSAPIHSSVSGTVVGIETQRNAVAGNDTLVVIETDKKQELSEDIKAPEMPEDLAGFVKAVRESGLVGLGGASFPTHIKYNPKNIDDVHTLIVNGAECEPFITSDHRGMLEDTQDIIDGMKLIVKYIGLDEAYIGIEANKPDAIEALRKAAGANSGIEVIPLKVKYPQGGEKQLIDAVLGRQVPSGGLPASVGVVVQNVATAYAVKQAVADGIPLVERIVTITGPDLPHPGNYRVAIGTPLSAIISAAGGMPESTKKVILGGPMMGKAASNLNATTNKGTSGILVVPERYSMRETPENCVRCASCVSVCPMGLEPYLLAKLSQLKDYGRLEAERVMDCIECGSCSYICISHRPLLDHIRIGKAKTGAIIKSRKSK